MIEVEISKQEKKDLAGIYGFLVEVCQAQQSKASAHQFGFQQNAGNPTRKSTDDKIVKIIK